MIMHAGQAGAGQTHRGARAGAFALLFCLLVGAAAAFGLEVPRLTGRVNDLAGMISPAARAALETEPETYDAQRLSLRLAHTLYEKLDNIGRAAWSSC